MGRAPETKSSFVSLFILIALFLAGFAIIGGYVFLANRLCPIEGGLSPSDLHVWNDRYRGEQKTRQANGDDARGDQNLTFDWSPIQTAYAAAQQNESGNE